MTTTATTGRAICPYCGVGCHIKVTAEANRVSGVVGDGDSPVNKGLLCPKGALVAPILELEGRLLQPGCRTDRTAPFTDAPWAETFEYAASRLLSIIDQHGSDAVALYGSGQLDTEAWYLGNKLFKGFLGSNHVDSNSRLCMASAVMAYRTMLGSDAPPVCYDDIDHADCFIVAGSNMADAHPVLFQRMKARFRSDPKPKLIVIDPRYTHTAQAADLHVALKPGSDIAFFNAIARIAIEKNVADLDFIQRHTNGFGAYAAHICDLDVEQLAAECGLTLAFIHEVAEMIFSAKALLSFFCMGLSQSTVGTAKNQAIIGLHLLLGQIGRVGAGPFSLTGQPNAMGGRELGGLAQLLPGFRQIEKADDRRQLEQAWGVQARSIHPQSGLTALEMFRGLEEGRIKAIWIVCSNPIASFPNTERARRALQNAELVIVQDCFDNETVPYAHVVFPAAQWVEKTGTMTNSERRVSRGFQRVEPPAEAKPDWWIFSHMAQALGYEGFEYDSIDQIWDEYRALTEGTPCDQSGITNARLNAGEAIQWPCPHESHPGTPRRYLDKQFATADGRANFVVTEHQRPREQASADYPFTLTTGRLASQWHTMTRTGKIPRLARQAPTPYVDIHPEDAAAHVISEGQQVQVSSRRGAITLEAHLSDKVGRGVLFMPFHWGDNFAPGGGINLLTHDAYDPYSKQPEYKACAVALQRVSERH
ncbi:MAG: nitrate reductase [Anaerolineae bacterium]|jgi:ferredoxin-nitrate reductase|nr:nitrate reductase [Anaerolineae bacterium]